MKIHDSTLLVDRSPGLRFTESPRWRDGKWWFLDIHGQAIKSSAMKRG